MCRAMPHRPGASGRRAGVLLRILTFSVHYQSADILKRPLYRMIKSSQASTLKFLKWELLFLLLALLPSEARRHLLFVSSRRHIDWIHPRRSCEAGYGSGMVCSQAVTWTKAAICLGNAEHQTPPPPQSAACMYALFLLALSLSLSLSASRSLSSLCAFSC